MAGSTAQGSLPEAIRTHTRGAGHMGRGRGGELACAGRQWSASPIKIQSARPCRPVSLFGATDSAARSRPVAHDSQRRPPSAFAIALVNSLASTPSCRRRSAPRQVSSSRMSRLGWIPAFAGMTVVAGTLALNRYATWGRWHRCAGVLFAAATLSIDRFDPLGASGPRLEGVAEVLRFAEDLAVTETP